MTVTVPPSETAVVVAGIPLVVVDVDDDGVVEVVVVVDDVEEGDEVDVVEPRVSPVVVDGDVSAVPSEVAVVPSVAMVVSAVDDGEVTAMTGVIGPSEIWSSAAPTTCQAMAVTAPVATTQAAMSPIRVVMSSSSIDRM